MNHAGCDDGGRSVVGPSSTIGLNEAVAHSEEFTAVLRNLVSQVAQAHEREIAALRAGSLRRSASEALAESSPSPRSESPPALAPGHAPVTLPTAPNTAYGSEDASRSIPVCGPASEVLAGGRLELERARSEKSRPSAEYVQASSSAGSLGVCVTRTASTSDADTDDGGGPEPRWQWMHRTGWRDYQEHESEEIERAYQAGKTKARLKSGKGGRHPMEIFFRDMLQHDNRTDRLRGVRRLGPDPWWQKAKRFVCSCYRAFETGIPRQETFMSYRRSSIIHGPTTSYKRWFFSRNFTDIVQNNKQFCKRVTDSVVFTIITTIMVALNTLWIGIELNQSEKVRQEDALSRVMGQLFCSIFFLEILLRLGSFSTKADCWNDQWFIMDSLCTFSMMIEAWLIPALEALGVVDSVNTVNLGVVRALRLCRITRMARLAKAIPEFATMMKGIATALRSVGVTLVMLLMFLYVFSIIFRSQVQGCSYLEASYFSSTQHAMWTLLLHGTLLDAVSVVAEDILAYSALLAATFLLSIFVTSFTVLNMLIGIIVGVVTSVKIDESERKAKKQLRKQLKDIMDVYDSDNTKSLNRVEFGLFIANPDVQRVLKQFEVDTWGLSNLAEHLFDDSDHEGTLLFEQILDVVVRLRGDNKIRMADVVQLRKFTDQRFEQTRALLTKHLSDAEPELKAEHHHSIQRRRRQRQGAECAPELERDFVSPVPGWAASSSRSPQLPGSPEGGE